MSKTVSRAVFGKSTCGSVSMTDAGIIIRFLAVEPWWPLLKAIWRAKFPNAAMRGTLWLVGVSVSEDARDGA